MIVRLGAVWAKHVEEWLDARELQEGSQRHESRAEDSTATRTLEKTTSEANLGAADSMDSCKPGTETTDRELDILDFTDPIVDPADCTKFTDNSTGFTDPTMESTGCTNCAKLTGV